MARVSTKERLMETALTLFSQKGYAATSVDEIAESIGIKGPNLYKYFKGKEDLFEQLTNMRDVSYKNNMGFDPKFLENIHDGKTLKEFSMKQIRYTISDDTVIKLRKMLSIEQFRNEELGDEATLHQLTNPVNLYIKLFSRMMEAGEIRKCDPEVLALEYVSPVTVLIQVCDRRPEKKDELLKQIEEFIDLFIEQNFE
ncbi:TetR/AcrR family transcriptional regulator [Eubacterium sp.]|uniref:TetR/AcrR family transcriptional regulator n=1 Tax=Eubacterium sp. TaxID=142586 RepID=UPI0025FCE7CB|nr:TetR/AcrR family transcriptional regulator [Eubacterium sp.]MCR5629741.1 TetR/AcrR family transcriptional regulator [Eubacterium sp.]